MATFSEIAQERSPLKGEADWEGGQAQCRICLETKEESSEALIAPCRCAGSIKYAHTKCILACLEHCGRLASPSEYRCDICRAKFRVVLGRAKPPGYEYLWDGSGDDAPGLGPAVWLFYVQHYAHMLAVLSYHIHGRMVDVCSPFPAWIGAWLWRGSEVSLACVELLACVIFPMMVLCIQGALVFRGPRWWPEDGRLDDRLIMHVLDWIDVWVGLSCEVGLMLRGSWSVRTFIFGPLAGGNELLPAIHRLLPSVSLPHSCIRLTVVLLSRLLHLVAFAWLLKRAFFDSRTVPVDILPASGRAQRPQWLPLEGAECGRAQRPRWLPLEGDAAAEVDSRAEDSQQQQ